MSRWESRVLREPASCEARKNVTRFLVATFLALVVLAGVGVGVARLVGASDSKPTGSNQVRGEPTRSKALLTPIVRAPMLRPRILVRAGYVGAFAQDGPRIAWLDPYARCSPVRVRNLRTGEDRPLLRTPRGCEEGFVCGPCSLALAGKRALWEESSGGSNSETDGEVVTAALDDRVKRDRCDWKAGALGGVIRRKQLRDRRRGRYRCPGRSRQAGRLR